MCKTNENIYYFCPQVGAIVKIQAFFRANKAREDYRMLGTPLHSISNAALVKLKG